MLSNTALSMALITMPMFWAVVVMTSLIESHSKVRLSISHTVERASLKASGRLFITAPT